MSDIYPVLVMAFDTSPGGLIHSAALKPQEFAEFQLWLSERRESQVSPWGVSYSASPSRRVSEQ